ncbi:MAG: glycosyltransferase family 8 protein [Planctomycetaceae bacterium]|nr:glycosyltransferase family 8 protein [Planctomycetaceae bacterium]MCP4461590.1 glycosyltransferase family 8 protein [Planctomycetaceae bacterium]MDG1809195.1 glycosyltransferase family 8 protein [Pirellulaceae bacterium]MDG2105438.1 glycosyltransferase family 8 protein [Pirellulaceae bacterium]
MIVAKPNIVERISSEVDDPSLTEVVVVCACDDNYAMPLTVMLHSAAKNLDSGSRLSVYFIDGGISESSWQAIKETLVDFEVSVYSLKPDYSLVEHLHTSHHVTPAAYLRLLTAEMLPAYVHKAIYLDSDLLVCDDLTHLWNLPLGDQYCLAVPDIACPYVDARLGCKNFRLANPYLAAFSPIPNYQDLGLDGTAEYFNSGVMVLNLEQWRQDQVAIRMLDCLEENREHVWCWDQYALNVVFHGNWGRLPVRWNQGAHVLDYPSLASCPVDRAEFQQMLDNPGIIHFTTEFKPWDFHWQHLRGDVFFAALDETAWRGWRPEDPGFSWDDYQLRQSVKLVKWTVTNYRKVVSIWKSPAR